MLSDDPSQFNKVKNIAISFTYLTLLYINETVAPCFACIGAWALLLQLRLLFFLFLRFLLLLLGFVLATPPTTCCSAFITTFACHTRPHVFCFWHFPLCPFAYPFSPLRLLRLVCFFHVAFAVALISPYSHAMSTI